MPKRTRYQWPSEARELVRQCLINNRNVELSKQLGNMRTVVTELQVLTGHPRHACMRFARQVGCIAKQPYREWTRTEQQRLLDLISSNPPHEVAKILRRSIGSIRGMLQRLGASAQMGRDWFTVYTLASVLHISATEVQKWIERGWLKSRRVETGALTKLIVDADDFCEFCKHHRDDILGRRLSPERLEFVRTYVFPPSHAELLPVRERGYKTRTDKSVSDYRSTDSPIHQHDSGAAPDSTCVA